MKALVLLAVGALLAASSACAEPEPEASKPAPVETARITFGQALNVTVAGRGLVMSEPLGMMCGNDGDQRTCEIEFGFSPDAQDKSVRIHAVPNPQWVFQEWVFADQTGSIAYDPPPLGLDRASAELVLTAGSRLTPDGRERPVRHRIVALFSPASNPPASGEGVGK